LEVALARHSRHKEELESYIIAEQVGDLVVLRKLPYFGKDLCKAEKYVESEIFRLFKDYGGDTELCVQALCGVKLLSTKLRNSCGRDLKTVLFWNQHQRHCFKVEKDEIDELGFLDYDEIYEGDVQLLVQCSIFNPDICDPKLNFDDDNPIHWNRLMLFCYWGSLVLEEIWSISIKIGVTRQISGVLFFTGKTLNPYQISGVLFFTDKTLNPYAKKEISDN
jgi:hypothetical protein